MKAIWTVISTVAVANMLAFGAFVGWLAATDRLDAARLTRIRQVLAETRAEERARQEREAQEARAAAEAAEEDERAAAPPLTGADLLAVSLDVSEAARARRERARREAQDVQRMMAHERALLDEQWRVLREERAAFDATRRQIADLEGAEQFRRALATYEGLKPDAVRTVFLELLAVDEAGRPDPDGLLQVVAYLNAMQDRTRAKVIDEFVDHEPALAAQLLERLRTYGLEPAGRGSAADDRTANASSGE